MLKQAQNAFCIISLLFTSVLFSQTDILINEDFSSGSLPTDWSNTNNGGSSGQVWKFTPTSNGTITAGNFSGNYAILDSDAYGNGNNQNSRLITKEFSTGIYETITLEFDYQYRDYQSPESCAVEVFNGVSWVAVENYFTNSGDNYSSLSAGSTKITKIITTEVNGASDAKIRFTYIGDWDYWWAIDNIKVTGTLPTPTTSSNGYLGPGGVGHTDGTSTLEYWIDANNSLTGSAPITSWLDLSGNSITNTISGNPSLTTNSLNGHDVITFDGAGDAIVSNLSINESAFPNLTVIALYKPRINSAGGVWGEDNGGWDRFILDGNTSSLNNMVSRGTSQVNNISNIYPVGTPVITTVIYQEDVVNGTNVYANNTLQTTFTSNMGPEASNVFKVGEIGANNFRFDGDIAELIVYGTNINTAERIIIDNYLSAKYNHSLTANNFYDEDTSGGNFDHKVAGIGQASDGSNHTDSQGTGVIRINSPTALSDGDFLFWGEDVKDATYEYASSADYLERLNTKWRVSEVGELGTVTLSFKESDIDLSGYNCGDLNLIVSSSSTFTNPTTTKYPLTLISGVYSVDVNLNDGEYFTIEYKDLIVLDGTQFYNGTGDSNAPNMSDECYKFLVKSSATGTTLTLTENAFVREVEVESGGNLVVTSGFKLQVENGLEINGDIRLVGSSQLIQKHTGGSQITGSGNLYIDQNSELTSVYRYDYWSSPVKEMGSSQFTIKGVMKDGTTATSATSTPPDLAFTTDYDGLTSPLTLSSYWIYGYLNGTDRSTWSQKGESGTFNPGEGYLLKSPGAAENYTFKGIPNDGDISFSIDADNTSLLGNPYPSAIDANQLFTDSPNLATIYFWEHKNELSTTGNEGHYISGYIGGYSYRNATMGTAADSNVNGTAGLGGGTYTTPGQYIPVGQGFFVETATGVGATVNFKNGQRYFETEAGDSHFFKTNSKQSSTKGYPILKFGFEAKNSEGIYIHSQVGISFSERRTYDSEIGFDSKKTEIKDSDIYFQFVENSDKLVIAGIQEITDDLLVPLTLKVDNEEDIFLMLDEKQNIDREVYIFDALENVYYETTNPIRLNLAKNIYENRFYIAFKNETLSIVEELFNKNFNIYQNKNTEELVVKNLNNLILQKISLFTLTGKKIIDLTDNEVLKNSETTFKTNKISTSVYIVNIITSEGVISKKIFIQ